MTDSPTSDIERIRKMMWGAVQAGRLAMWTVYRNDPEYPGEYVARLFEVGRGVTGPQQNGSMLASPDLEILRHILLVDLHLTVLPRSPEDDPNIVETWV
jgi:hypothetical protein